MMSFDRILCPVDFSDPRFGSLGAPPLMQEERDVEEQQAVLRQFMGPAAGTSATEIVVGPGDACSEILQQAVDWKADLIVMGTHGRTGLRHVLLGSVTEKESSGSGADVTARWRPG